MEFQQLQHQMLQLQISTLLDIPTLVAVQRLVAYLLLQFSGGGIGVGVGTTAGPVQDMVLLSLNLKALDLQLLSIILRLVL